MNVTRANATSPVFGMPSLAHLNGHASHNGHVPIEADDMDDDIDAIELDNAMDDDDEENERDPDAMDWSPIHPARRSQRRLNSVRNDDVSLRPQRFFAPEDPTGLENLFEKTIKLADDDFVRREEERRKRGGWRRWVAGKWNS